MKHETVLVTGGAGYIGSHAVMSLLSSGRKVIVIDRDKDSCENLRKIFSRRKNKPIIHCCDIDNDVWVDGILQNEKPTAVMHFAANISVPESVMNPLKYFENNTAKTIKFLSKLHRNGIHRFIFSSTAAVYGSPTGEGSIVETTPCQPINAYGNSKLMTEFVLKQMSKAIPAFTYTSFRYFNVAGSHISGRVTDPKWKEKENVFPRFMSGIMNNNGRIYVYGTDYPTQDGTCVRDYIHPEDIVSAHMIALDNDIDGVYNLGSGTGHSVWNIVESFVSVTGRELDVIHKPRRTGDPALLIADSTRFRSLTGWEPTYTLKDMVATAWKTYGE
tara:strand:+ start:8133 stop:9122 length:990 start_codon:yes stop_codon:yes gene_type:complete